MENQVKMEVKAQDVDATITLAANLVDSLSELSQHFENINEQLLSFLVFQLVVEKLKGYNWSLEELQQQIKERAEVIH